MKNHRKVRTDPARLFLAPLLLLLASPAALALGLGEARVQSYLQEPLDARIRLISRSAAELSSVTASLASAEDFRIVGLNRAALPVPLEFTVNRDIADPYIQITSRLPVLEPVVQIAVDVVWAGGRMLRQYTLFLDPPTFPAAAPLPGTGKPQAATSPATPRVPPPDQIDTVSTVRPSPQEEAKPTPEPRSAEPQAAAPPTVAAEPAGTGEQSPSPPSVGTGPDYELTEPAESAAQAAAPAGPSSEAAEAGAAENAAREGEKEAKPAVAEAPPLQDEQATVPAVAAQAEAAAEGVESRSPGETVETPVAEAGKPEATATERAAAVEAEDEAGPAEAAPGEIVAQETGQGGEPAGSEPTGPAVAPAKPVAEAGEPPASAPDENAAEAAKPVGEGGEQPAEGANAAAEPASSSSQPPGPPPVAKTVQQAAKPAAEPRRTEPEPVYHAVIPETGDAGETVAVAGGDTLWGIANGWRKGKPYDVNQVMLAIQQRNPGAFNRGNINSLKAGAILRMPADQDLQSRSARQAMLEVMRQEDVYRNHWDEAPAAEELPAIADQEFPAGPAEATGEAEPGTELAEAGQVEPGNEAETGPGADETDRLQLVPPSLDDGSAGAGLGEGASEGSGVSSGESVVEELARTQEELANAQQENTYLNQRIEELQAELSRREAEEQSGLADTSLAEMQESLAKDRQAGKAEQEPVAITPPREKEPWYARFGWLVGGLLLLAVAGAVWWLRTRAADAAPGEPDAAGAPQRGGQPAEPTESPAGEDATTRVMPRRKVVDLQRFKLGSRDPGRRPDEEAVELDADDPETRLDLARAYLSMGNPAAARTMLEAVLDAGSETQVAEARKMLDEL